MMARVRLWAGRMSLASIAPLSELFSRFLRTLILSRLLAPDEFGTAIAITVVNMVAELSTDFGLEQFVITRTGEAAGRAMAAAHALQLLRGFFLGAAIALASPFVASFFGVPERAPAFALAGMFPLFRSFSHLGVKQKLQQFAYGADAAVTLSAGLSGLLATLVSAWMLRDHRAVLFGYGTETLISAVVSHALARTRYAFWPDRQTFMEALRWGAPLTLNGVGLAIIGQADRFVMGRMFGVEALGTYAVIYNLVVVPMVALIRISAGLAMPLLVKNKDDSDRFQSTCVWLNWIFALTGFFFAVGCGALLDTLAPFIFGDRYIVSLYMRMFASLVIFARLFRISSTIRLLASGQTGVMTMANMVSGAGVVFELLFATWIPDPASVMAGAFAGELALLITFLAIDFNALAHYRTSLLRCASASLIAAATLAGSIYLLSARDFGARFLLCLICTAPAILLAAGVWRRWRRREAL